MAFEPVRARDHVLEQRGLTVLADARGEQIVELCKYERREQPLRLAAAGGCSGTYIARAPNR